MEYMENPVVKRLAAGGELAWLNPLLANASEVIPNLGVSAADVDDAQARLARFAPFIARRFEETAEAGGFIESPLTEIPNMRAWIAEECGAALPGRLFLKRDSDLPISGSIKARGGIYEVLKHAEELALSEGLLKRGESYEVLDSDAARAFFSRYTVQAASTGNLGLSIGIMSAALGFRTVVHMSADAREWKKALLRSRGVTVMEYPDDYSAAVERGREASDKDPMSYFIDDENSKALFFGYAVAARRLKAQLDGAGVAVDASHPLFVYLPCGVGGGPGGVAFGLKLIYGDCVHVFFVEPTEAPCMLLGMATGLHSGICVRDIGLSGLTQADGLAVGRASGFIGRLMEGLLSGEFTVRDERLFSYMRALTASEGLFAEPSACAAFAGPAGLFGTGEGQAYIQAHGLAPYMENAVHIPWATGGSLVPREEREKYARMYIDQCMP